jgi:hypothetical protein
MLNIKILSSYYTVVFVVRLFELFEAENLLEDTTPEQFLNRIAGVIHVLDQATFPGEKHGAQLALDRLLDRSKEIAQGLPAKDKVGFLTKLNKIIGRQSPHMTAPITAPDPTPAKNKPHNPEPSYDFQMPEEHEILEYARLGTGLQAEIRTIPSTVVKDSKPNIQYYEMQMQLFAKNETELRHRITRLGWRTTHTGNIFWSTGYDRFVMNKQGKTFSDPITGTAIEIQKKLHDYNFKYFSKSKNPVYDVGKDWWGA